MKRKSTAIKSSALPLPSNAFVLTVNAGSSSIKFALYAAEAPTRQLLSGKLERIGLPKTTLTTRDFERNKETRVLPTSTHRAAGEFLIQWLDRHIGFDKVTGIGHRVVHGGLHLAESQRITPAVIAELHRISPYAPEHLPAGIQLMKLFHARHRRVPQVACFDTAFHREMPRVAKLLSIPRRFDRKGVQRFGFHGLSYTYLLAELEKVAGRKAAHSRVIMAHLGNGASLAAVRNGKGIDTSMGFTPAAGVPMSTRSGDVDPGLVWYLARTEKMSGKNFHKMVHQQSGLLGVSEISPDMRDLLEREGTDVRAAEAVALFCYQVKKWIGGFTAALGGLDTLIFAGGIGENAYQVRERICDGLDYLGLRLDTRKNQRSADVVSKKGSRVTVRVIRTDEEIIIAQAICRVLNIGQR